VTDRARPLSWSWQDGADAAVLTFSNRLTRVESSVSVSRASGESRGECPQPVAPSAGEALVVATLVQTSGGVTVARETAELAYVPGASGRAMTVRTKAGRDWSRVGSPRISAFDAKWWNVTGASGYEVLWEVPAGWHRVERKFAEAGVVDETALKFGMLGFLMLLQ